MKPPNDDSNKSQQQVEACPECNKCYIHKRFEHNVPDDEGVWWCYDCQSSFDEPIERDPKTPL